VNDVLACVKTKRGLFVVKFWAEWSWSIRQKYVVWRRD